MLLFSTVAQKLHLISNHFNTKTFNAFKICMLSVFAMLTLRPDRQHYPNDICFQQALTKMCTSTKRLIQAVDISICEDRSQIRCYEVAVCTRSHWCTVHSHCFADPPVISFQEGKCLKKKGPKLLKIHFIKCSVVFLFARFSEHQMCTSAKRLIHAVDISIYGDRLDMWWSGVMYVSLLM